MKWLLLWSSLLYALIVAAGDTSSYNVHQGLSYRAILDTDVDTDDLFALLYLLKSNRSEFNLQVLLLHIYSVHFNIFLFYVASFLSFVFACHCQLYLSQWVFG
ncbi:putative ribonucleoside hydrolase [Helianthus annuus]|nr:putative ribonucleoside hydrolase [Helianthus annuus]KAJ0936900.1 putative ribonucleoside hydrolase [Helianthus annuus]